MKIVYISGGLGNQMFQYAFYRKLKETYKENVLVNLSYFSEIKKGYENCFGYDLYKIFNLNLKTHNDLIFNINSNKIFIGKRILFKIFKILDIFIYFEDRSLSEEKNLQKINKKDFKYFWGYWQSEKYFKDIEEIIKEVFIFPKLEDKANLDILDIIQKTESVSIHIRRGDYVGNIGQGGLAPLEYYQKAVEHIKNKVKNPYFFIFSNDIEWCQENIKLENSYYIDWNTGENSYKDMQLMSLCKHNIIPNSTFSWWGAWLNKNPNKIVIAPEKWFNECSNINDLGIVPEKWIKIKNY